MLKNYIKVALRNMFRRKLYTAINIAGLAIGMACAILIMIWVRQERSFDRFHEKADRLYRVAMTVEDRSFHGYYMPGALADYMKETYPEVAEVTNIRYLPDSKLAAGEQGLFCTGAFVHDGFFDMFSFPFIAGDRTTAFSTPLGLVITEDLALKLFGKTDVIGQTVRYADAIDVTVSAVLAKIPANSDIRFDFLVSFLFAPPWMKQWDNKCVLTYVLLSEDASPATVGEKLWNEYNEHNPGAFPNYFYLQSLTDSHLHNLEAGWLGQSRLITYVYIFSVLAAVVLAIACINFMNLSTAGAVMRAREIGLRKVVGAHRRQLAGQFLIEAIIFSCVSLIIALVLIEAALPLVNRFFGLQLAMSLSWDFIVMIAGIAVLTGVLSGSYPALFLSSFYPAAIFQGQGRLPLGLGKWRRPSSGRPLALYLRRVLVVVQFAVSIFLIIAIAGLYTQFDFIRKKDMGFAREDVLVLPLQGMLAQNSKTIKNELLQNPEIAGVTRALSDHVNWHESCGIEWEGKMAGDDFDVGFNRVDYDYASALGLEVTRGRFFSEEFASDATSAFVLNEAVVRRMGLTDPIGMQMKMPALEREGTIIGVVGDFHNQSMRKEIAPFAFVIGGGFRKMFVRMQTDDLPGTVGFIESTVRKYAPDDPFAYTFLDRELESLYQADQMTGKLFIAMAALAVFISCLGLFGMASYLAERRIREIGVRKVFGASSRGIIGLLSKELLILVAVSNIFAWPAAYYIIHQWLQGFAYRSYVGWPVYILAALAALLLAQVTIMYNALKAARSDPVRILRYE